MSSRFFSRLINRRKSRETRYSESEILIALSLYEENEYIGDDLYQASYHCLNNYQDKIYRILFARNEPMHINEIAIELNLFATKYGETPGISPHHVSTRLAEDKRFSPIGRSGIWILKKWEGIATDYILTLMEEALHSSGCPLSMEDIFSYVKEKRPVEINAIGAYLSDDRFSRVGPNLFALTNWGMKSLSVSSVSRSDPISTVKLCELVENVFVESHETEILFTELAAQIAEITGSKTTTIYNRLGSLPALEVVEKIVGKQKRKFGKLVVGYRAEISKLEILTKEITTRELIQKTVLDILKEVDDTPIELRDMRDRVAKEIGCPKSSVYSAIDNMYGIEKTKNETNKVTLGLLNYKDLFSLKYKELNNQSLVKEITRSLALVKIDSIDLALFQLGKIFEATLKKYMTTLEKTGNYKISSTDYQKLYSMIKWVKENKIITDETALQVLRVERNERGHGFPPDFDEREALLRNSGIWINCYLDYICLIEKRCEQLSD